MDILNYLGNEYVAAKEIYDLFGGKGVDRDETFILVGVNKNGIADIARTDGRAKDARGIDFNSPIIVDYSSIAGSRPTGRNWPSENSRGERKHQRKRPLPYLSFGFRD